MPEPRWKPVIESLARQAGQDPDIPGPMLAGCIACSQHRLDTCVIHKDPQVGPAVRWAILHDFTEVEIADYLNIPLYRVRAYMRSVHSPTANAQRAVALVKGGRSVNEVRDMLDLKGKGWVYRTLEHALVLPDQQAGDRGTSLERRQAVIRMYRRGEKYKTIAQACDTGVDNVKRILREANRAGELPEYGSRQR